MVCRDVLSGVDPLSDSRFKEIIVPAVKGTTSILRSALKCGTSVKRIVVTSSTAAVNDLPSEPSVYSEDNWNEIAISKVEELGREATGMYKYKASKALAEKGHWLLLNLYLL